MVLLLSVISAIIIGGPCLAANQQRGEVGYNLAFVDADVRHVADAVLGDMLKVSYSVDSEVVGKITLRTDSAVDRSRVIALLENALQSAGAVLIARDGGYRVVTREAARGVSVINSGSGDATVGYSSDIVELRYANSREIARLIRQFVGKDVVADGDIGANRIIITGSAVERDAAMSLVNRFDVDMLARSTFELIKLENVEAEALEAELRSVFQAPLDIIGTRVRLVPLPRMRSILAIAANASDIARIRPWISQLDAGWASTKRRLHSYAVQNGRARDLAQSLQSVLGRGVVAERGLAPPQPISRALLDATSTQGGAAVKDEGLGESSLANQTVEPVHLELDRSVLDDRSPGGGASRDDGYAGPRIVPVDTTNTLLIYANGEDYDFIREALAQIDRPVPQIMIEATLAEVTLTRDLQYGVNWSIMSGNSAAALSNTDRGTPAASFPGFSYSYIGKSVEAVLNTLQSRTNVRVLSAPKLMVLNNQTATLEVGDQVPIVTQQSQGVLTNNAPLINTVEMRDTGVILKVTPRVNESGTVTLDIAQEVSDVVKTTTSGINSPTIEQRRLISTIATRSGQMVALGGLIRENSSRQRQGVPGLSQIPVVGGLFGQHTTSGSRTELIILLTPLVMRTHEDAHRAVDELLSRMEGVRPLLSDNAKPVPHAPRR